MNHLLWLPLVLATDRVAVKINPGTNVASNFGSSYQPPMETPAMFRQPSEFVLSEWSADSDETQWRALMSPCLSYTSGEYRYEVCLFQNVSQFKPGQQFHVNMGVFDTWTGPMKMRYTDGNACASGKRRQTEVTLVCSDETVLSNIAEPATCEYTVELKLPLACSLHQPDFANTPLATCTLESCLNGVDTLFDCIHVLWKRSLSEAQGSAIPPECTHYIAPPVVAADDVALSDRAQDKSGKAKRTPKHGRWDLRHPAAQKEPEASGS